METITRSYYAIGCADESNTYYEETLWDEHCRSREEAEKKIKKALRDWGEAEGNTRKDYDISKITVIIERGV